ncbi:conserved Plasmodium protein, unknown function [Plasmodium malariae]|uniref:Uncharacterized protein n=1 Tax=Plasmodium malariae TaxID=5858 RepID=A0A1A8WSB7_PLAMA|nr:conserved Plasmodium protein, unknown function [Plasmodium malariae]
MKLYILVLFVALSYYCCSFGKSEQEKFELGKNNGIRDIVFNEVNEKENLTKNILVDKDINNDDDKKILDQMKNGNPISFDISGGIEISGDNEKGEDEEKNKGKNEGENEEKNKGKNEGENEEKNKGKNERKNEVYGKGINNPSFGEKEEGNIANDEEKITTEKGSNLMKSIDVPKNYEKTFEELLNMGDEDLSENMEKPEGKNMMSISGNEKPKQDANNIDLKVNNDMVIPTKEQQQEENHSRIKGYVRTLLNEEKINLKLNINKFFKKIFNLIVREKIMSTLCSRQEEVPKEVKLEEVKTSATRNDLLNLPSEQNMQNENDEGNTQKSTNNEGVVSELKSYSKNKPAKCPLSKLSKRQFYKTEDIYSYYTSLEEMLKNRKIRIKTDSASKHFTFHPIEKAKEDFERMVNNNIFIEAVRTILFDSYNKKEKYVYSSFAIVIDTLFSLIKEEKVVTDMYKFVRLFLKDLNMLNWKILDFLKKTSFNGVKLHHIPNLSKTDFEFILAKIYSRSVLGNILSNNSNSSYMSKISKTLKNNSERFLKFSFLENSEYKDKIISNEGSRLKDSLSFDDESLCKYIPIKKK